MNWVVKLNSTFVLMLAIWTSQLWLHFCSNVSDLAFTIVVVVNIVEDTSNNHFEMFDWF